MHRCSARRHSFRPRRYHCVYMPCSLHTESFLLSDDMQRKTASVAIISLKRDTSIYMCPCNAERINQPIGSNSQQLTYVKLVQVKIQRRQVKTRERVSATNAACVYRPRARPIPTASRPGDARISYRGWRQREHGPISVTPTNVDEHTPMCTLPLS